MCQICYASGYGLKMEDIYSYLKDDFKEYESSDLFDKLKSDTQLSYFSGEDDLLYIRDISPYEKPLFESIEEIDCYIYNQLKPFLIETCTQKDISNILDDVFDWEYC